MTSPERARSRDRKTGIDQITAAFAAGRITANERDRRIVDVEHAETIDEITMSLRDLPAAVAGAGVAAASGSVVPTPAPAAPAAGGGAGGPSYDVYAGPTTGTSETPRPPVFAAPPPPVPSVPYGSAQPGAVHASALVTVRARSGRLIWLLVVIALTVGGSFASVVVGIVHSVTDGGTTFGGVSPGPVVVPDDPKPDVELLTHDGFAQLFAAVKAETGSTLSYVTVIYPTYASIEVPVGATGQRYESYFYDGELRNEDLKGTETQLGRLDLATIDGQVFVKLLKRATRLVENATSQYIVLQPPDSNGTVISAYASNEFNENVYLQATADGTVTYNSTRP